MIRLTILILTLFILPLSLHAQHKVHSCTIRQQMEAVKKEYAVNFVYDASLKLDIPYMSPLRKVESNHCIIKSSIKHVLKTHNDADIQRYTVA